MIDTIGLMINGVDGKDFNLLNPEITRYADGNVKEKRAYFSLGNTNALITYSVRKKLLLLSFSIPQLLYGNNVKNFAIEDTELVIPMLQEKLNGILEVDYSLFKLFRIDFSRNFIMSRPAKDYIDYLSLGSYKGIFKDWKKEGESIVLHNGNRSITFYDKFEQMKDKSYFDIELITPNYLRMELRLKKAKVIRDTLKLVENLSFPQLLTNEFFDKTKNILLETFNKEISPFIPKFQGINKDKEIIEVLKKNGMERNLINYFCLVQYLKSGEYNIEYIKELFKEYIDVSNINKTLKRVLNLESGEGGSSELLEEIRSKFEYIN